MWTNLNFSKKVWLLVSVFIFFSLITGFGYHSMINKIRTIGVESSSNEMLNGYKNELKDIVDVMAVSLSNSSKNATTDQERYNTYSTIARKARFFPDKSGYFFIVDENGTMFMHAAQEDLETKDLISLQDADGKYLIKELGKAAKKGGDFVEYLWDKPGKGVQPKLSYATMIPGSKYYVGTGVYIDDIKEKEGIILSKMDEFTKSFLMVLYAVLAAIFFLIIMPLTLFMIKSMVVPLTSLTDIAVEYSRGKLDGDFGGVERKDEVGALSRAVQRLGRSTQIVMQKLQESK